MNFGCNEENALTRRLIASLNFWKMEIKSCAGGGRARIISIPSAHTQNGE